MSNAVRNNDESSIFNPEDFHSVKLAVYFKNLTTRTEVKSASTTPLVEIGQKTLVFELPSKSCNTNHSALVEIKKIDHASQKEISVLSVTGKVKEIEELGEGSMKVIMDCIQYDETSWEALLSLYAKRQDEITNFLKSIRGY